MGGVIMNERMDTPLEGLRRDLMGVVMNERMDTLWRASGGGLMG